LWLQQGAFLFDWGIVRFAQIVEDVLHALSGDAVDVKYRCAAREPQPSLEHVVVREELEREVEITVLHEIGHYFGLDEDELEALGLG
jgi:hypothetical protein